MRRHVACGSTTCSYFGTLHLEASKVLADVVEQQGQRAHACKPLLGECDERALGCRLLAAARDRIPPADEEDVHRRVQLLEAENLKVKEERDEALTRVQELEAKLEQATAG